ncbi:MULTISPECIES: carbohydrate ABC transporter permease [unclassified Paenibacillus]|uniref:carbohydrate ABC transporter permease n=1 Tax=unclassified Paenibacillus TaxID=185978 RepID=UPI0004F781D8|nr:carbohydrate ABC transporter permease [Paenibacillus sp. FSL R5-0345]AIQ37607.1 sugar ABC transporter permease [Paenibacillus sp. FSL R5-0345]
MNTASHISSYSKGPKTAQIILHLFFIAFSMACILPIVLIVAISLTNEKTLTLEGYKFFPDKVDLSAYQYLFNHSETLIKAYGISLTVTLIGTLLAVLLIALYAYPLYRKDFPFKKVFNFYLLITMLFSGGLVPFYLLYVNYLNLKDSLIALILPGLSNAFYIFITRTFFQQTVPEEMIESGKLDGASEWRIFFQLVLPISLPVLATIGLFTTLMYWNDWFNSMLFINDTDKYSLQYVMIQMIRQAEFFKNQLAGSGVALLVHESVPTESLRMAMVVVSIGPILFIYPFFQKYFTKGLTIGAIKG